MVGPQPIRTLISQHVERMFPLEDHICHILCLSQSVWEILPANPNLTLNSLKVLKKLLHFNNASDFFLLKARCPPTSKVDVPYALPTSHVFLPASPSLSSATVTGTSTLGTGASRQNYGSGSTLSNSKTSRQNRCA